ncbi:MAG TPA: hypothetical protein VHK91_11405 [Flavisolibacter sp.]|nr:hypothetical protein [Flavisolibacter sp.]
MPKQHWIGRPLIDVVFIILPPFFSLAVIFLFPSLFHDTSAMSDAGWVVLILLVDVAHVYSTLYRTYFDPQALTNQRSLLWSIPLVCFAMGVLVYSLSSLWFWRLLAYIAVFHFVRQQYGFMRVYSRREPRKTFFSRMDAVIIYTATLYPLAYWHLSGPRNFNWFINGDFLYFSSGWLLQWLTVLYFLVIACFIISEMIRFYRRRVLNLPRLLVITGTLLSWYFGIVYFNGDMAFTLLNVVSHGIPYMALIWIYGDKNYVRPKKGTAFLRLLFSTYGILLFIGLLFLFAFIEEGLWDLTVWKEHANIFGTSGSGSFTISHEWLSILVPILALPQITHYVLDGFIWKVREEEFKWSTELKVKTPQ